MYLAADLAGSLFSAILAATSAPADGISAPECDFGQKFQVRNVTCEFAISNTSEAPRTVVVGKPAYPTDSMTPATITVAPHGTAKLTAKMDLSLDAGNAAHSFMLSVRDGKSEIPHEVVARGFVESVLDEPRTILDFGVVDLKAKEAASKAFDARSDEFPDLKLTGVLEKPSYLDVALSPSGDKANLKFGPQAPWSFVNDVVRFKTNSAVQPEVAIQVQADLHGDVLPDSNPYNLGMFQEGGKNEFAIRITDRTRRPLHVGNVSLEGIQGHVEQAACTPKADDCRLLKMTVGKEQPLGHAHGRIAVELPDYQRQLGVNVWGLYVKHGTVVKDLNEEIEKASQGRTSSPAENGASKNDLKEAIHAATTRKEDSAAKTSAPPEPPPGHGPLLRWSVANESLVRGYLIYRADSEKGPFSRLTSDVIFATRSADGSSYQWRDNGATVGKTYWYYIVTLFNDGKKQRLSGVAKVVAK